MSKDIIKTNLKSSDLVEVIYNGKKAEMTVNDFYKHSRPYKIYRALITQSSTNAPTVVVLENTFHDNIVWTRNDVGNYYGTLPGVFIANKTFSNCMNSNSGNYGDIVGGRLSDNVFELWTASAALASDVDGLLTNASLEIIVYE